MPSELNDNEPIFIIKRDPTGIHRAVITVYIDKQLVAEKVLNGMQCASMARDLIGATHEDLIRHYSDTREYWVPGWGCFK